MPTLWASQSVTYENSASYGISFSVSVPRGHDRPQWRLENQYEDASPWILSILSPQHGQVLLLSMYCKGKRGIMGQEWMLLTQPSNNASERLGYLQMYGSMGDCWVAGSCFVFHPHPSLLSSHCLAWCGTCSPLPTAELQNGFHLLK